MHNLFLFKLFELHLHASHYLNSVCVHQLSVKKSNHISLYEIHVAENIFYEILFLANEFDSSMF